MIGEIHIGKRNLRGRKWQQFVWLINLLSIYEGAAKYNYILVNLDSHCFIQEALNIVKKTTKQMYTAERDRNRPAGLCGTMAE